MSNPQRSGQMSGGRQEHYPRVGRNERLDHQHRASRNYERNDCRWSSGDEIDERERNDFRRRDGWNHERRRRSYHSGSRASAQALRTQYHGRSTSMQDAGWKKRVGTCGCRSKSLNDRRYCTQCRNLDSTKVVPEALMAAQWCSSAPRQHPPPRKENFLLDKESGWKYDPSTNYYVVSESDEIFYDGVAKVYLKYNEVGKKYEEVSCPSDTRKMPEVMHQSEGQPRAVYDVPPPKVAVGGKNALERNLRDGGNDSATLENLTGNNTDNDDGLVFQKAEDPSDLKPIVFEVKRKRLGRARSFQQDMGEAHHSPENKEGEDSGLFEKKDDAVERARAAGKFVCTLCRRAFRKQSTYDKHLAESYLHKANLERKRSKSAGNERSGKRRRVFKAG